jgi:hypothetical protein
LKRTSICHTHRVDSVEEKITEVRVQRAFQHVFKNGLVEPNAKLDYCPNRISRRAGQQEASTRGTEEKGARISSEKVVLTREKQYQITVLNNKKK